MILGWLLFCCALACFISALFIWPIARHSTLPRRKKWLLSIIIFLLLGPGSVLLYGQLGMPPMVLF